MAFGCRRLIVALGLSSACYDVILFVVLLHRFICVEQFRQIFKLITKMIGSRPIYLIIKKMSIIPEIQNLQHTEEHDLI